MRSRNGITNTSVVVRSWYGVETERSIINTRQCTLLMFRCVEAKIRIVLDARALIACTLVTGGKALRSLFPGRNRERIEKRAARESFEIVFTAGTAGVSCERVYCPQPRWLIFPYEKKKKPEQWFYNIIILIRFMHYAARTTSETRAKSRCESIRVQGKNFFFF